MSDPVNVRDLSVGTRVRLATGAEAEVIDNPRDGIWLLARYVAAEDSALLGTEEMIFAPDVVAVSDKGVEQNP
jgi:hypothetical protein